MTKNYSDFLKSLSSSSQERVKKSVQKIYDGKFGNCKKLRTFNNHDSTIVLSECVVDFGPGYRVYFTVEDGKVNVLTAGTKKTQHQDINFTRTLLEK